MCLARLEFLRGHTDGEEAAWPEVGLVFCSTLGRPDSMSLPLWVGVSPPGRQHVGEGTKETQPNPEFTILGSVYRRKSLPARDSGFNLDDIYSLSESQALADYPSSVHLSQYRPHRNCLFWKLLSPVPWCGRGGGPVAGEDKW